MTIPVTEEMLDPKKTASPVTKDRGFLLRFGFRLLLKQKQFLFIVAGFVTAA